MLPTIISSIVSIVMGWFDNKKEEQKTKAAIEQNKQRLALEKESYNAEWEMAALANSDKWLRRISFCMFAGPLVIAIIAPGHVHNYFSYSLQAIPEWWVKTFVGINGSVWGISTLKNSITGIIGELKNK